MTIKKSLLTAAVVGGVSLAMVATVAMAEGTSGTTLVDKIAQRFNLNKADVQKVFDENKQQNQADREAKYEARLSQAVKDGKLTEAQKTKLITKHKELVAKMEAQRAGMKDQKAAMESKTDAERQQLMDQRRTEMQKQRDEITQWEKDNNIPAGYLGLGAPDFGGRGRHFGAGK